MGYGSKRLGFFGPGKQPSSTLLVRPMRSVVVSLARQGASRPFQVLSHTLLVALAGEVALRWAGLAALAL